MGDADNKRRAMESEMDRFEAEISSLTRQPNFIPAQLRRHPAPVNIPVPTPPVIAAAPVITRPAAPAVISAAPQKYSSADGSGAGGASSSTISSGPIMNRPMVPVQFSPATPVVRPAVSLTIPPVPTIGLPGPSGLGIPPIAASSSSIEAPKVSVTTESAADKQKKKNKKSKKEEKKPKKSLRCAGGQIWEDQSLVDWDPSDFRLFCGDLGNDVTDEVLTRVFGRYPSFQKAKVIRDKRTNKTKGYGFVSFKDPADFVRAIKELDGRYVGSRPIKLRKSNWRNRNVDVARKREKERNQLIGITKKSKR